MKTIILVGDGMGDYPEDALGGKTPLQYAQIPAIRGLAAAGELRMVRTVPEGMEPGSDVANLSLLGYNPAKNYTGRAPIEAAGAGIPLGPRDAAFRCNLVTIADGAMDDYSAGHIETDEGRALVETLQERLGREGLHFHGGVGYRHLLVWQDGPVDLRTQPPHDISGRRAADYLPSGERADEVRALMDASRDLFAGHPVNEARRAAGRKTATQIWLWGQGRAIHLPTYPETYNLRGGVISAVDLVRGLGVLAGLRAVKVPGATGFIDTNYAGKVQAALGILRDEDFVYVHVEAPDECGHMGDTDLKVQAIEAFDREVVGPVSQALEQAGEPYALMIATDHRTPLSIRGHTDEPVPMLLVRGPVGPPRGEAAFDEFVHGGHADTMAHEWIGQVLREAGGSGGT